MIKDLLIDWDIAATEYYNQFNRHELEFLIDAGYWTPEDELYHVNLDNLDKETMIKKLIEKEYTCRINDTIEDLKEEIEYLQKHTIL